MRIIHDIEGSCQVSAGTKPYLNKRGWQGYNGSCIDLGIFQKEESGEEPIFIEGNTEHVLEALKNAVSMIEHTIDFHKRELGELLPTDCPNCALDGKYENATHKEDCPVSIHWETEMDKARERRRMRGERDEAWVDGSNLSPAPKEKP